ncbi:MAG TPA: tetratricopeptide repeat protein [Chthoniobacteraceae bacterium]|jgi:TolA-binding protein|nr:tetratricopeptide repeat protein [Chthoniobacteraceae bacterium]
MASPAATTPPASSAPEEFDPLVFWIKYRSQILMYLTMLVVALALYFTYWKIQQTARENSEAALAGAKTTGDYKKVADEYPKSAAAANALLLLADKLRAEGKLDESTAALKSFIERFPKHSLISGAYTSLAANQEAQGKLDDALVSYKKVTTNYPTSFSAAAAYIAQGRILDQQGKTEDARHAYETVMTQFAESPFRDEAMAMMRKAKK